MAAERGSLMKKALLGIIALVAIAGAVVYLNLGGAVKKVIETAGSEALGAPVHVGGVKLKLAERKAGIAKLSIGNPPGFKSAAILTAADISVTVADVTRELVTIEEVLVDGMVVNYELGAGGTNLKAMEKAIAASRKAQKAAEKTGQGAQAGVAAPDVIIKRLKIVNATLVPSVAGMGSKPVPLPEIVLTNLGSGRDPATPGEIAAKIMNRIIAASSNTAIKSRLTAPVEKAKEGLKGLLGQ